MGRNKKSLWWRGQVRICVDLRDLNKACSKEEFALPNMDVLIDSTSNHGMFSFVDGFSGYNQIKMTVKDAEKTAFRTPFGNFYYTVMPFWSKNVGAMYQRAMTSIFHDMMGKEVEDYVNNLVVKAKDFEDHLQVLERVFRWCRLYSLKMKPKKYAFEVSAGVYCPTNGDKRWSFESAIHIDYSTTKKTERVEGTTWQALLQ